MKFSRGVEVKSGGKTVTTVDIPEFEPNAQVDLSDADKADIILYMGEAYASFKSQGEGAGKVLLGLINTQNGTNIKNEARAPFNRKMTKSSALSKAQNELNELDDAALLAIHKDKANGSVNGWIERRAAQILAEAEAARKAAGVDDDDNDGQ